jgi:uncharacterized protein YjdB
VVTAVAPGSAVITVTATSAAQGGFSAATATALVPVTVTAAPVGLTAIAASPASANLGTGKTVQIVTTATQPAGAPAVTYAYESSTPAVATVSGTGLVTAVAPGTSTIKITGVTAAAAGFSAATATTVMSVTVTALPAGISSMSVTPATVALANGKTAQLAPAANQPTGAAAATYAYASNNQAVATVSAGGLVTAVAPGTAVITVTASSAANADFSASTATANVAVTVTALPAGLTAVAVTPSSVSVATGKMQQLAASATQPQGAPAASYAYVSSNTAVATVSASGEIAGVAPGSAVITVTATSAANADFAAGSATASVPVTVTALPTGISAMTVTPTSISMAQGNSQVIAANATQPAGAPAATYAFRSSTPTVATVDETSGTVTAVAPGNATITVTASSAANGDFAAGSASVTVPVTVTAGAQVTINSLTNGGQVIDIANVRGQVEINLGLQPNGQTITSVQAWLCNPNEAVAACATRSGAPAAQQSFGASGAQGSNITLYVNSAEFAEPDWTTGANANTLYKNGLKTIVATISTAGGTGPTASNNRTEVNFNNADTWTIRWTQPTNRANDAAGNTWYGGPDTPDALLPGSTSGTSSFVVVPVLYTEGRTITSATLNVAGLACGNNIVDTERPFAGRFGAITRSIAPASVAFDCSGAQSSLNGVVPAVVASIDNNNAAGPTVAGGVAAPATSIFTPLTTTGLQAIANRYAQSIAYRPTTIYAPFDYVAPAIAAFDVRGGGGAGTFIDSAWVNGTYAFNDASVDNSATTTVVETRYQVSDAAVGLLSARNTQFSVCNSPATWSDTEATTCPAASAVKNGGLDATVTSMGLTESADITNRAYFAVARETDRLGNRAESNPRTYTIPTTAVTVPRTPGINANTNVLPSTFGVDLVQPQSLTPPRVATATAADPTIVGFVTSDIILSTNRVTDNTTNDTRDAGNATFGVRASDSRSGFATCVAGTNCPGTGYNIGTFQIQRYFAPTMPSAVNAATVENLINTSTTTGPVAANVMNGNIVGDGLKLDWSIPVFGASNRAPVNATGIAASGLTVAPASSVPGYYVFTATIRDRAGNTATVTTRRVLIDNRAPDQPVVLPPSIFTGGATIPVTLQASDDADIVAAEFTMRYPSLVPADAATLVNTIRFPRVAAGGAFATANLFRTPFAALTDNKIATPIGLGQFFTGSVNLPIPFIQSIQTVDANNAPTVPVAGTGADDLKPNRLEAVLIDAKETQAITLGTSTSTAAWFSNSRSTAGAATIGAGQVAGPTTPKNWTGTPVGSDVGAGIASWSIYTGSSTLVEFRAVGTSSSVNPPFQVVHVIRRRFNTTTGALTSEQDYLGTASYVGSMPSDNGLQRIFRYQINPSLAALAQGNNVTLAGFGANDEIRAIGVDASGNGLATRPSIQTAGNAVISYAASARHQSNFRRFAAASASATNDTLVALGTASPIVLQVGGPTLIVRGAAASTATGATGLTYTCTSSDNNIATVAVQAANIPGLADGTANALWAPTCVVTPVAPGAVTITNTATATASAASAAAGQTSNPVSFTTAVSVVAATPTITGVNTAERANTTGGELGTVVSPYTILAGDTRGAAGATSGPAGWAAEVDNNTATTGIVRIRSRFKISLNYQGGWSFFSGAGVVDNNCSTNRAHLGSTAASVTQLTCTLGTLNPFTGELEYVLTRTGDIQMAAAVAHTVRTQSRAYSASGYANPQEVTYLATPSTAASVDANNTSGGVYNWAGPAKTPTATTGGLGATAALIPQVQVTALGGGVNGVAVTFTITGGGSIASGATTSTTSITVKTAQVGGVDGIARLDGWTMPATAGTSTVTAVASGITNSTSGSTTHAVVFTSTAAALPNAISGAITTGAVAFPRNMTNAAAVLQVTLAGITPAGGATNTFSCSSSSALITAVFVAGNCELTPAGVADAAGNAVTITFTATGGGAGFTPNVITSQVTVTRIP